MRSLTFIEVDVPFCSLVYGVAPCTASLVSSPPTGTIKCFNSRATCQDIANFDPEDVTIRFAKPTDYLPSDIECIPSILDVSFTPATISLGENLGTRATLSVTFKDHPHSDTGEGFDKYLADRTYDPYSQGTFWGKFRARQPFLQGQPIRWITGLLGDDLADMETRHFIVESFDGPTPDGKYTLVAKDVLKLVDGDRSQAPPLNSGFLNGAINTTDMSFTLSPSGIGNSDYAASGTAVIGGNEIVTFTRSSDSVTITARALFGTSAVSHAAQDRFQEVLRYDSADPADIIYQLMVSYAGVPSAYITLSDWQAETSAFLGRLYTAKICEPTSVGTLISELIQQACLSIWWDDAEQKVRLRVLRGILTDANTFTPENTLQGTLTIKEQPEKRISQVWTYFGPINAVKSIGDTENYRSTSIVIDDAAEEDYGTSVVKKIFSRWIPALGRTVADRLGAIQLGRYRDPPRRLTFDLQRYAETDVLLGEGYRVEAQCIQDATGAASDIPIQITRLNPGPDRFKVEAEEMLFTAPDEDLVDKTIIIDSNINDLTLIDVHNSIYPPPLSGDTVTFRINPGVIVGSSSVTDPAITVGAWPAGVTINLDVQGRIQGRGGNGGQGATPASVAGSGGQQGGRALYTRYAINLLVASGAIWAGGGGGGGGGASTLGLSTSSGGGGGGGGGAGTLGGLGGVGGAATGAGTYGSDGAPGQPTAGAGGGSRGSGNGANFPGFGANGGGPGLAGGAGGNGTGLGIGGAGGAAGNAIDGVSYVTVVSGPGDIRGGQVN